MVRRLRPYHSAHRRRTLPAVKIVLRIIAQWDVTKVHDRTPQMDTLVRQLGKKAQPLQLTYFDDELDAQMMVEAQVNSGSLTKA